MCASALPRGCPSTLAHRRFANMTPRSLNDRAALTTNMKQVARWPGGWVEWLGGWLGKVVRVRLCVCVRVWEVYVGG